MINKPLRLGAAAALLALSLLTGCVTSRNAPDHPDDAALLKSQADAWDQAIIRKDRAAIEANMADDFRQIDAYANVANKATFLEEITDKALTINPYGVEDFDVRIYGDVALLAGRTQMSGSYDGKPFTSHYRYTDVYVRRNGRWQVVNVQITKVPPPAQ